MRLALAAQAIAGCGILIAVAARDTSSPLWAIPACLLVVWAFWGMDHEWRK